MKLKTIFNTYFNLSLASYLSTYSSTYCLIFNKNSFLCLIYKYVKLVVNSFLESKQ